VRQFHVNKFSTPAFLYNTANIIISIMKRNRILGLVSFVAIATTLVGTSVIASSLVQSVYAQSNTLQTSEGNGNNNSFTAQKTAISKPGKLPIHQSHQVVTVLPPRNDGKVWVGTITWASSKPIEVEMWHYYNSSVIADAAHGKPVLTPFGNNRTIAFTLLKPSSGTPLPSGSLNFAGSELSFHTLDGTKFTVAYTVDATAKRINQ
jgi:hypothetical protein